MPQEPQTQETAPMTQQQATPQTAAPQGPDPAALQAELAGFRQLAGALLGREIKPDETAGALSLQIAQQREADSRRALEMRAGIAEGLLSQGLACPDPEYLRFKAQSLPDLSGLAQKGDWNGLLGKALEMGLVSKQAAQAAAPALPPPTVRPAAAAPTAQPDPFAHVQTPADVRKLTASQLMELKKTSPDRYRQLTQ